MRLQASAGFAFVLLAAILGTLLPAPAADQLASSDLEAHRDDAPPASGAPTGAGAVGYIESYAMRYPFRHRELATHQASREALVATLTDFGLHVVLHEYENRGTKQGVNVLAFQNGTVRPDEWIVMSAHYDSFESTVYGAWDDGAGVALLLEYARAFAHVPHDRTIVYAFFDDEEQGLLGSAKFVRDFIDEAHFVANLNFDPPGLNWPCADAQGYLPVTILLNDVKKAQNVEGYALLSLAVESALDTVGVPTHVRAYGKQIPVATLSGVGLYGGSDHESFDAVDVPNVFLGSAPTTTVGPVAALTFPLHTPIDTLEAMDARCGGRMLLEMAFQVHLDIAAHVVETLDSGA